MPTFKTSIPLENYEAKKDNLAVFSYKAFEIDKVVYIRFQYATNTIFELFYNALKN